MRRETEQNIKEQKRTYASPPEVVVRGEKQILDVGPGEHVRKLGDEHRGHKLWHADFHHGILKVYKQEGRLTDAVSICHAMRRDEKKSEAKR